MEHATLRVLTPTRMLDQGPVRILNSISVAEPKPHRHRVVRCRRRRSREGPFHHHFLPVGGPSSPTNTSNCSAATPTSEHSSVYSLAAEMDMTPTRPSVTPDERSECINPVALTLWRGGEEDREWLQEQDRSWSHSSPVASPSTRIPAPRQVSNSLRDVYGANYYCEISRPIPMLARRQEDAYFVNRMKWNINASHSVDTSIQVAKI